MEELRRKGVGGGVGQKGLGRKGWVAGCDRRGWGERGAYRVGIKQVGEGGVHRGLVGGVEEGGVGSGVMDTEGAAKCAVKGSEITRPIVSASR